MVVQALHEALAADRFALFAQPILPLGGEHTEPRFEFLLRMVSENSELLPPEKFLSAAERYQLLPAIDRWVVKNALAALAGARRRRSKGRAMRFSMNISGALDRLRGVPGVPRGEHRATPACRRTSSASS